MWEIANTGNDENNLSPERFVGMIRLISLGSDIQKTENAKIDSATQDSTDVQEFTPAEETPAEETPAEETPAEENSESTDEQTSATYTDFDQSVLYAFDAYDENSQGVLSYDLRVEALDMIEPFGDYDDLSRRILTAFEDKYTDMSRDVFLATCQALKLGMSLEEKYPDFAFDYKSNIWHDEFAQAELEV